MEQSVKNTLYNLHLELINKSDYNGIIFEIYRLNDENLECYTYPKNEKWKKKLFAFTTKPISYTDMLSYCMNNFQYEYQA